MKIKLIIAFLALAIFSPGLRADVVTEGEITVTFRITNLNEFSDYQFFFLHQGYTYDEGWREGDIDTVFMEDGGQYSGGREGDKSYIFARNKVTGQIMRSDMQLGGKEFRENAKYRTVLQDYSVSGIEGGVVVLKEGKKLKPDSKGEFAEPENDGFWHGFGWMYWLLPLVCLVSLLAFFILRKRPAASFHATVADQPS